MVSDYIFDGHWNLPPDLFIRFPDIWNLVNQITIPLNQKEDELIWMATTNGSLSFKDAYAFMDATSPLIHWANCIWSPYIPPSKSLMAWRIMNDKMPVDESQKQRGCVLPSVCSLCLRAEESSFHLFFDCAYAVHLW